MSQSMTSKPYKPYTQPPLFCPVIQNGRRRLPQKLGRVGSSFPRKCGPMIEAFWSEENQRERLDYRSNPGES